MAPNLPASLRTLLDAGAALVRKSPSGKVLLGRLADVVHPDGLPQVMRDRLPPALERARSELADPLDAKRVKNALKRLDSYEEEPLAVRVTSQVHVGELEGERVAAKVQRPRVAQQVRSDLSLLDALAAPLGGVFGALDIAGVLREVREMTLDELDLEHEAETQRQARRALRGLDGVRVPEVLEAEPDLLVTELLDGPTLADAEPDDPRAVARALVVAHLAAWTERGLLMTDARPGHVVLLKGGGIGLLGTGIARNADRARARALIGAFCALRDEEPATFVGLVSGDLGMLGSDEARGAHALLRELLGALVLGEARLDNAAVAEVGERALERLAELMALGRVVTADPADIPAARMLGQLAALLARLGAVDDWVELSSSYARP